MRSHPGFELAQRLGETLRARGTRVVTAESCTGGLLAGAMTDVAGSSDWFDRGYVTYSNAAKESDLQVPAVLLARHGAVSEPVAAAMAAGALDRSHAELAVAITGIAGPGGAVPGKPVGTVCFGFADRHGDQHVETRHFSGDREAVRTQAVVHALTGLIAWLQHHPQRPL